MNLSRFQALTARYPELRVAIVGDFCLDRYFEIDPGKAEISLETGLTVHNVMRVRCQPGGSGTILNNLAALGIGRIHAVGIAGEDGEGWELCRALRARPGVVLDHFIQTPDRHTFTYSKPLLMHAGKPPEELNRLDIKNWAPTPAHLEDRIINSLRQLVDHVDAFIFLEQADLPDTGVITTRVLAAVQELTRQFPRRLILADSRRGLAHFPPVTFKMNRTELGHLLGIHQPMSLVDIHQQAVHLARKNQQRVIISLAEEGIVGASPQGQAAHVPAFPVRGEIDIVGAGDAVTANLTAALAAGSELTEALTMANAAASIVIHQLGTTGTASVDQLASLLQF
jgi:rfaE bifunctional protein kinase chain/domain